MISGFFGQFWLYLLYFMLCTKLSGPSARCSAKSKSKWPFFKDFQLQTGEAKIDTTCISYSQVFNHQFYFKMNLLEPCIFSWSKTGSLLLTAFDLCWYFVPHSFIARQPNWHSPARKDTFVNKMRSFFCKTQLTLFSWWILYSSPNEPLGLERTKFSALWFQLKRAKLSLYSSK